MTPGQRRYARRDDNGGMRIVHVTSFYGKQSEGFSALLRALGAGYRRAGHEFVVLSPGTKRSTDETDHGTYVTIPVLPFLSQRLSFIPVDNAVRRALAEWAPDRVEVSDTLTLRRLGQWANRAGIPAVMVVPGTPSAWILRSAASGALNSFPGFAVTTEVGTAALRLALGAPASSAPPSTDAVTHLPVGVDLELFTPLRWSAAVRRSALEGAEVLILAVGELSTSRSPERAITALRQLVTRGVRARLVFVGDGPLRARLERSVEDSPVTFVGRVDDRPAMAVLLASADLTMSLGGTDSASLADLESLAAGTPVVAPDADAVEAVLARRVEERRTDARAVAAQSPWSRTVDTMLGVHGLTGQPAAD